MQYRLIYSGSKFFWRTAQTVDVNMYLYEAQGADSLVLILPYDPTRDKVSEPDATAAIARATCLTTHTHTLSLPPLPPPPPSLSRCALCGQELPPLYVSWAKVFAQVDDEDLLSQATEYFSRQPMEVKLASSVETIHTDMRRQAVVTYLLIR